MGARFAITQKIRILRSLQCFEFWTFLRKYPLYDSWIQSEKYEQCKKMILKQCIITFKKQKF